MMELEEAVRPCWMEIDLAALAHNTRILQQRLGSGKRIIAALKGDAYGHGIGPVARCLEQSGVYSVATGKLEDARAIREAGVELPILMFAGPLREGVGRLLELGLTPTVHDRISAEAVSKAATRPTAVYIKVDSGMRRLGVPLPEALEFIQWVGSLPQLAVDGVYTHLTFADETGRVWAKERYAAFDRLLEALEAKGIDVPVSQALASSALMAGLESRANAVCPGSLLYGISPVNKDVAIAGDYRPVVKAIKSRLIQIGSGEDRGRWGVLPIGLADGYRKLVPDSGAYALWRGGRVPIAAVSLEYISLDLTECSDAQVGDEFALLGEVGDDQISLGDLAGWQGAAPHEALMSFEGRLRVKYLGG